MEQAPVLIVVIPLLFAIVNPLLGWWKRDLCYFWTLLALTVSAGCSVVTLTQVLENGTIHYSLGNWAPPYGIEYVIDHLNGIMLILVSISAWLVAIYSKQSVQRETSGKEVYFYTILLLQVVGFQGIVITGDLFNLYVFLEVSSLTGYALIAVGEKGALLASFRYLIMGTVGACFYLLGVGYLYFVTGSLNIADLAHLLPPLYSSKVVLVAFAFFLVGVAIKMALFPLHVWLPDAYTRAPSTSSALLAPLTTKISIYVLMRIFFAVFEPTFSLKTLPTGQIMTWLSVIAIAVGALMALAQTDYKRMACYIVVAEVGYIAGGIGLANHVAIKGAILHLINDSIMTLGLFVIAGIIAFQKKGHALSDFKACFQTMPFTMTAFVIVALSLIGVPPTGGFFSKWYLIHGAIIANNWTFVAALLGSSLVNVILFFRIFEIAYGFQEHHDYHREHHFKFKEAPLTMLVPAIVIAIGVIAVGLYNQSILIHIIHYAVPSL
jgi:multicomponent Na+:H+ antiporter subunit D